MRHGRWIVLALGLLLFPGRHAPADTPWRVTTVAACQQVGVPASLALAVVATESGGHPYAIRVNTGRGAAHFPATYAAAVQTVTAVSQHTTNVDLGLFQLNYREVLRRGAAWTQQGPLRAFWQPLHAVPPVLLLAPAVNALVGCVMLRQALEGGGPRWQQIGRYHSPVPTRQYVYAQKVFAWLDRLP
jgi:soluble lytic murein transglycosylase-like protein